MTTAQDAAIVLATAPHLRVLSDLLKRSGVDVDTATARGTFRPLDAAETLAQVVDNGVVDADRFRQGLLALIEFTARGTTRERPRIAIFGECGSLLCTSGLLDQALATLPEAQRQTFVLHAEAEMSYREVAETLQISIGTVMSRLFYARQKLRAYLSQWIKL